MRNALERDGLKKDEGEENRVHFWVHSTQTCTTVLVCVFKVFFSKNGMSLYIVFIYFSTHLFEMNLFQIENFQSCVIPLFIQ